MTVFKMSVVRNPLLPEYLYRPFIIEMHHRRIFILEGMGGGPESHHRLAGFCIVQNVFRFGHRQGAEAGEHHHEISILQRLQPFDMVRSIGIDDPGAIQRVANGDCCPHLPLEDLGQHRHRFFRTIFFIPRDEDDMWLLFVRRFGLSGRVRRTGREKQQNKKE